MSRAPHFDQVLDYEKISPTMRIDVFDAAVFGVVRMLLDSESISNQQRWFGTGNEEK